MRFRDDFFCLDIYFSGMIRCFHRFTMYWNDAHWELKIVRHNIVGIYPNLPEIPTTNSRLGHAKNFLLYHVRRCLKWFKFKSTAGSMIPHDEFFLYFVYTHFGRNRRNPTRIRSIISCLIENWFTRKSNQWMNGWRGDFIGGSAKR